MNVAYHLHKQKINPAVITKIGIDEEGKKLINIFSEQGVCTEYFQVDYEYGTGKVYANLHDNNEAVYDIVIPVAWDYIKWEEGLRPLVENADIFVFGSLAARNSTTRATLFRLLQHAQYKVLDLNLRAPHYTRPVIQQLLEQADLVKMNLEELEMITGWFSGHTGIEDRLQSIHEIFGIHDMVVTMGADGSIMYRSGQITKQQGYTVTVQDTVGSGDAFLAGLLAKTLDNASSMTALRFATALGALIATKQGACPEYGIEEIEEIITTNDIKN